MHIVGLTGGIATGKSTASCMFAEQDLPIVDADLIAREVVQPGQPAYNKIVKTFGTEILKDDHQIDRPKLGALVFNDAAARKNLNGCTHPYIRREMLRQLLGHFLRLMPTVILDTPLLFESGLNKFVHTVVVVYCPESVQKERLMKRDGLSDTEAQKRINAQMSIEKKKELADDLVDNSGTLSETQQQLRELIKNKLIPPRIATMAWWTLLCIPAAVSYSVLALLKLLKDPPTASITPTTPSTSPSSSPQTSVAAENGTRLSQQPTEANNATAAAGTTITTTTAATNPYTCVPLANSTICTAWKVARVNVSVGWTVATFDTSMSIWADSAQHIADFNEVYGCSWAGNGLRYVFSYGCAERIFESDRRCNIGLVRQDLLGASISNTGSVTSSSSTLQNATLAPMCYSSCMIYLNTLASVFQNDTICPTNTSSQNSLLLARARNKTLTYIAGFCNRTTTNDTHCVPSVPLEDNTCGFGYRQSEAMSYCRSISKADPCCSKVAGMNSESEEQKKKLALIASVLSVIAILLLGATLSAFVALRRRRQDANTESRTSLLREQHKIIYHDGQAYYCSNHHRPDIAIMLTGPEPKQHVAIHDFVANLGDEITLCKGDIVLIKEIYNDGWVTGVNLSTGLEGAFPAACVSPKDSSGLL
ncbi:hypothetical protein HK102_007223 [Quaeritorhiza haematococci]|nr:hypothetical protein HK102_007223 [Quaeritorhiza haematococci]